ncbi:MAG: hypothetical protein RI907_411 [Pseudomonadota bacterium]|jgi:hypothetical protein
MSDKTLLFYERIVALRPDEHRSLRMKLGAAGMHFAAKTHSVLLSATELPMAALDYPCVFVNDGSGSALIALMGLREGENLMVDAEGKWAEHRYVPAFVRRYPFILAEQAGNPDMTVCFDETFAGFSQTEGEALFNDEGKPSAYLEGVQNLLLGFHRDLQLTQQWIADIEKLGLLTDRSIGHEFDGNRTVLQGFKVVDEAKLKALSAEQKHALFESGAMGWIYIHLVSMNNVAKLGWRLDARMRA